MNRLIAVFFSLFLVIGLTSLSGAANIGAVADGDWSDAATWTVGGPPGSSDTAYIGSSTPVGSAAMATVTLTADQAANSVVIGWVGSDNGTLDLGAFNLTVSNELALGKFGGTGQLLRTTGHFETPNLLMTNAASLSLIADDRVTSNLNLQGGSQLVSTDAANLSGGIDIRGAGSKLTANAPLTLTGNILLRQDGTLDLNSQDLEVQNLTLGWIGSGGNLLNDAAIIVHNDFAVEKTTFALDADDSITDLTVIDASVTLDSSTQVRNLSLQQGSELSTLNSTSVNRGVTVREAGSQLTLAAPMTLTGSMLLRQGGTVDLNGQDLEVQNLTLGWIGSGGNLLNDAVIIVHNDFAVEKTTFALDADDSITDLTVIDASVTLDPTTQVRDLSVQQGSELSTINSSSVNRGVTVREAGSKLTLTAPMTLTGSMLLRQDGTVDLNGQDLEVQNLTLGWIGSGGNLINDAAIIVHNDFAVEKTTFALDADDSITDLTVIDASVTLDPTTQVRDLSVQQGSELSTINSTSINRSVSVRQAGSKLMLTAPMTLTSNMLLRDDGTVDLNGQDLEVEDLTVGWIGSAGNLVNDGALFVRDDLVVEISHLTLTGGNDTIGGDLTLTDAAVLSYIQGLGEVAGLTLEGNVLDILDTNVLELVFDGATAAGLDSVFQWANPSGGGDRILALNTLIGSGAITVSSAQPFSVFDNGDGYTHIGFFAIPEPSAILLSLIALSARGIRGRRRRA